MGGHGGPIRIPSFNGIPKDYSPNVFIPVFLPSIIFGLFPFSVDECTSKALAVYAVAFHVLYRCGYVLVLVNYIQMYDDMDFALLALLATVCLLKASCVYSHIVGILLSRSKLLTLIETCCKKEFIGNRYNCITILGVCLWPVPLILRQTVDVRLTTILYTLGGVFDILSVFSIAMQYCILLEIATKRFTAAKFSLFLHVFKLETATDIHNEIINFTKLIHSIYGRTILIEVCYLGFDFIVALYDAIMSIRVHRMYLWGVCTFCYSMGCILTILVVCNACERVKKKAEKFNSELFRLMRENKELCKNEKLQLYVTMKQTVNFTACGFFTLGYPLVTSIIAAATTYLVILVQFSMPPSKS